MNKRIAVSMVAASFVAACSTPQAYQPSYRANPTAANYPAGPEAIDYTHGMWGTQPLRPPAGLVLSTQGALVGHTVFDRNGVAVGSITAVLEDAANLQVRYVIASSSQYPDDLVIPFTAINVTDNGVAVGASLEMLMQMPRYSYVFITQTYPMATAVVPPPAVAPAPVPPIAPVAPLRLAYAGSIVGYPVTDSMGQPLGRVEAVAVVPTTGEVRYAIVANPSFGLGSYIEVPAADARTMAGNVVVAGTNANWMQAPRYTSDQLRLQFSTP